MLRGLRQPPFEPLDSCKLKHLALKTVFLVALATAARVSELHALSAMSGIIKIKENKSEMRLKPFERFLAKNQRRGDPPRKLVIKVLRHHAPQDDPERLLCPVQALSEYLKQTNKIRGRARNNDQIVAIGDYFSLFCD